MNYPTVVMTAALMVVLISAIMLSMKEMDTEKKQEKMSFECGYLNMNPNKTTFSTNFIMVIILFLVFDLEASIMVPMVMSGTTMYMNMVIPSMFLATLSMVMAKEWLQGALEWSK